MGNKQKKLSGVSRSKNAATKSRATFMRRAEPTATLSTKRRGAQRTRTLCGAVTSRLPSNAETKRCTSGTKAVHLQPMWNWELEGRDAFFFAEI